MHNFRQSFEEGHAGFVCQTGIPVKTNEPWAPVIVTKEQIDDEISRLASLPAPGNGRRSSLIVHPAASLATPGLAPGIQVTLNVLKPGEQTVPFRHNATEVNFCIQGRGHVNIAGKRTDFGRYDVWNMPSWVPYCHGNDSDELMVMLTYTNVPLLQHMQIHMTEEGEAITVAEKAAVEDDDSINPRRISPYGTFQLTDEGAMLMPYEKLINPPVVESNPLHWPWKKVEAELKKLEALGQDYIGRRLYLLYNPITGRTNGTTPNFFATMTIRPPKIVDRPHRHASASINYYFHGSGRSSVAGNVYEWKAGDLMLSAPGWAVHNHASYDDYVYELTIQDQPLTIAMESLLWQENLKEPAALLGAQMGFDTNRG
ncbi:cupin domain-containing protein [Pseudomaricurvus alkylphenolicus]|uniref:cupin domain-containing protein n=1 Tax=Pseudomaricurvus alkylphenolicus TaxID=1306991 RepID=UPI001422E1FA|nr:cupin domain-containing protein [Pseudomaricurvus alkylphenolicus]NIB38352.1 cupin domain-containing protein [Pseudomaricurvus alkylphenolicus]